MTASDCVHQHWHVAYWLVHPLVRVTRAWVSYELDVIFRETKAYPLTMDSEDGYLGV
jgi:hypothetical protein